MASSDKIELVKAILPYIEGASLHLADFVSALENSDNATVSNLAVAARSVNSGELMTNWSGLWTELPPNRLYSGHLQQNSWMFGSEYSQLLDRRTWTRDEELDFMLRRTVDNYLEIVEIKTPAKDALLRYDRAHHSWYPSATVSLVLGQVMHYIEEVERNRDSILSKDGYDTLKIHARIILGRDGSKDHQHALRNLNAHLHRIEIMTFDQLIRVAKRVLAFFEQDTERNETELPVWPNEDEVPF